MEKDVMIGRENSSRDTQNDVIPEEQVSQYPLQDDTLATSAGPFFALDPNCKTPRPSQVSQETLMDSTVGSSIGEISGSQYVLPDSTLKTSIVQDEISQYPLPLSSLGTPAKQEDISQYPLQDSTGGTPIAQDEVSQYPLPDSTLQTPPSQYISQYPLPDSTLETPMKQDELSQYPLPDSTRGTPMTQAEVSQYPLPDSTCETPSQHISCISQYPLADSTRDKSSMQNTTKTDLPLPVFTSCPAAVGETSKDVSQYPLLGTTGTDSAEVHPEDQSAPPRDDQENLEFDNSLRTKQSELKYPKEKTLNRVAPPDGTQNQPNPSSVNSVQQRGPSQVDPTSAMQLPRSNEDSMKTSAADSESPASSEAFRPLEPVSFDDTKEDFTQSYGAYDGIQFLPLASDESGELSGLGFNPSEANESLAQTGEIEGYMTADERARILTEIISQYSNTVNQEGVGSTGNQFQALRSIRAQDCSLSHPDAPLSNGNDSASTQSSLRKQDAPFQLRIRPDTPGSTGSADGYISVNSSVREGSNTELLQQIDSLSASGSRPETPGSDHSRPASSQSGRSGQWSRTRNSGQQSSTRNSGQQSSIHSSGRQSSGDISGHRLSPFSPAGQRPEIPGSPASTEPAQTQQIPVRNMQPKISDTSGSNVSDSNLEEFVDSRAATRYRSHVASGSSTLEVDLSHHDGYDESVSYPTGKPDTSNSGSSAKSLVNDLTLEEDSKGVSLYSHVSDQSNSNAGIRSASTTCRSYPSERLPDCSDKSVTSQSVDLDFIVQHQDKPHTKIPKNIPDESPNASSQQHLNVETAGASGRNQSCVLQVEELNLSRSRSSTPQSQISNLSHGGSRSGTPQSQIANRSRNAFDYLRSASPLSLPVRSPDATGSVRPASLKDSHTDSSVSATPQSYRSMNSPLSSQPNVSSHNQELSELKSDCNINLQSDTQDNSQNKSSLTVPPSHISVGSPHVVSDNLESYGSRSEEPHSQDFHRYHDVSRPPGTQSRISDSRQDVGDNFRSASPQSHVTRRSNAPGLDKPGIHSLPSDNSELSGSTSVRPRSQQSNNSHYGLPSATPHSQLSNTRYGGSRSGTPHSQLSNSSHGGSRSGTPHSQQSSHSHGGSRSGTPHSQLSNTRYGGSRSGTPHSQLSNSSHGGSRSGTPHSQQSSHSHGGSRSGTPHSQQSSHSHGGSRSGTPHSQLSNSSHGGSRSTTPQSQSSNSSHGGSRSTTPHSQSSRSHGGSRSTTPHSQSSRSHGGSRSATPHLQLSKANNSQSSTPYSHTSVRSLDASGGQRSMTPRSVSSDRNPNASSSYLEVTDSDKSVRASGDLGSDIVQPVASVENLGISKNNGPDSLPSQTFEKKVSGSADGAYQSYTPPEDVHPMVNPNPSSSLSQDSATYVDDSSSRRPKISLSLDMGEMFGVGSAPRQHTSLVLTSDISHGTIGNDSSQSSLSIVDQRPFGVHRQNSSHSQSSDIIIRSSGAIRPDTPGSDTTRSGGQSENVSSGQIRNIGRITPDEHSVENRILDIVHTIRPTLEGQASDSLEAILTSSRGELESGMVFNQVDETFEGPENYPRDDPRNTRSPCVSDNMSSGEGTSGRNLPQGQVPGGQPGSTEQPSAGNISDSGRTSQLSEGRVLIGSQHSLDMMPLGAEANAPADPAVGPSQVGDSRLESTQRQSHSPGAFSNISRESKTLPLEMDVGPPTRTGAAWDSMCESLEGFVPRDRVDSVYSGSQISEQTNTQNVSDPLAFPDGHLGQSYESGHTAFQTISPRETMAVHAGTPELRRQQMCPGSDGQDDHTFMSRPRSITPGVSVPDISSESDRRPSTASPDYTHGPGNLAGRLSSGSVGQTDKPRSRTPQNLMAEDACSVTDSPRSRHSDSSSTSYNDLPSKLSRVGPNFSIIQEALEDLQGLSPRDRDVTASAQRIDVEQLRERHEGSVSESEVSSQQRMSPAGSNISEDTNDSLAQRVGHLLKAGTRPTLPAYLYEDPNSSTTLPISSDPSSDTLTNIDNSASYDQTTEDNGGKRASEAGSEILSQKVGQLVEAVDSPLSARSGVSTGTTLSGSINYDRLQQDLDEIQNSLSTMQQEDLFSGKRQSIGTTQNTGPSSLSSDPAADTSKITDLDTPRKQFSWDHSADIGAMQDGRFVSSMRTDDYVLRPGRQEPEGRNESMLKLRMSGMQPLLMSDIVPIDVALDIIAGTNEALENGDLSLYMRENRSALERELQGDMNDDSAVSSEGSDKYLAEKEKSFRMERDRQERLSTSANSKKMSDDDDDVKHADHTLEFSEQEERDVQDVSAQDLSFSQRVAGIMERDSPTRDAYKYLEEAEHRERQRIQARFDHSMEKSSRERQSRDEEQVSRNIPPVHADQRRDGYSPGIPPISVSRAQDLSPSAVRADSKTPTSFNVSSSSLSLTPIGSAPFSAYGNAQNFLTAQLDKVSRAKFDQSADLHLPISELDEVQKAAPNLKVSGENDTTGRPTTTSWYDTPEERERLTRLYQVYGRRESSLDVEPPTRLSPVQRTLTDSSYVNTSTSFNRAVDRLGYTSTPGSDPSSANLPTRVQARVVAGRLSRDVGSITDYRSLGSGTAGQVVTHPTSTTVRSGTAGQVVTHPTSTTVRSGTAGQVVTHPTTTVVDSHPWHYGQPSQPDNHRTRPSPTEARGRSPGVQSDGQSTVTSPQVSSEPSPRTQSDAESSIDTSRLDSARALHRQTHSTSPILRPYRPHGSHEVYYVESGTDDGAGSVAPSETTIESSHIGSDDAQGPSFAPHVLGTRKDPPAGLTGVYSKPGQSPPSQTAGPEPLSTIQEMSFDDRSQSNGSSKVASSDKSRNSKTQLNTKQSTGLSNTTNDRNHSVTSSFGNLQSYYETTSSEARYHTTKGQIDGSTQRPSTYGSEMLHTKLPSAPSAFATPQKTHRVPTKTPGSAAARSSSQKDLRDKHYQPTVDTSTVEDQLSPARPDSDITQVRQTPKTESSSVPGRDSTSYWSEGTSDGSDVKQGPALSYQQELLNAATDSAEAESYSEEVSDLMSETSRPATSDEDGFLPLAPDQESYSDFSNYSRNRRQAHTSSLSDPRLPRHYRLPDGTIISHSASPQRAPASRSPADRFQALQPDYEHGYTRDSENESDASSRVQPYQRLKSPPLLDTSKSYRGQTSHYADVSSSISQGYLDSTLQSPGLNSWAFQRTTSPGGNWASRGISRSLDNQEWRGEILDQDGSSRMVASATDLQGLWERFQQSGTQNRGSREEIDRITSLLRNPVHHLIKHAGQDTDSLPLNTTPEIQSLPPSGHRNNRLRESYTQSDRKRQTALKNASKNISDTDPEIYGREYSSEIGTYNSTHEADQFQTRSDSLLERDRFLETVSKQSSDDILGKSQETSAREKYAGRGLDKPEHQVHQENNKTELERKESERQEAETRRRNWENQLEDAEKAKRRAEMGRIELEWQKLEAEKLELARKQADLVRLQKVHHQSAVESVGKSQAEEDKSALKSAIKTRNREREAKSTENRKRPPVKQGRSEQQKMEAVRSGPSSRERQKQELKKRNSLPEKRPHESNFEHRNVDFENVSKGSTDKQVERERGTAVSDRTVEPGTRSQITVDTTASTDNTSFGSYLNSTASTDGGPPKKKYAWAAQEETLQSIPEDSTLDSLSSELTATSGEDTDFIFISHSQRHLPDDPKLMKLHRKILRQKEKYHREATREQRRRAKIAKLEELLKERGRPEIDQTTTRSNKADRYERSVPKDAESSESSGSKVTSTPSSARTTSDTTTLTVSDITTASSTLTGIGTLSSDSTLVDHSRFIEEVDDATHQDVRPTRDTTASVACNCHHSHLGRDSRHRSPSPKKHPTSNLMSPKRLSKSPARGRQKKDKVSIPQGMTLQEVDYSKVKDSGQKEVSTGRHRSTQDKAPKPVNTRRSIPESREDKSISHPPSVQHSNSEVKTKSRSAGKSEPKSRRNKSPTTRDVSVNVPTPLVLSPPTRRAVREVTVRSEAVQTTPRLLSSNRDKSKDSKNEDKRGFVSIPSSPPPRQKSSNPASMFQPESSENVHPTDHVENPAPTSRAWIAPSGMSFFVPLSESRPWRKPLRERQAHATAMMEVWPPLPKTSQCTPPEFASWTGSSSFQKTNRYTDRRNEDQTNTGTGSQKLSLQEAFEYFKSSFISHSRERQKHVALRAEERRLQELHNVERAKLFFVDGPREPNPEAHPLSYDLHKPKRRQMTKEEIKELTQKRYQKLPEVLQQRVLKKRQEEYKTNRLRAQIYKKKVQNQILRKKGAWVSC